ncbi:hypothetical protein C9374_001826 [Naegleria lovaniensis]|uniref:Uncharacterized protein n=1 Tax=Naegleria lovaniensis TaxID=51637 RepID=A0AA88GQZ2_NAELO|nr:uncharacterized protein C9374_001826 [Naegleria lovaniensis]KAG2386791.1 hypothetical protein C9374_001826 [Naegleria lovaniensis]
MFSQVVLYLAYTLMELLQFLQYHFGIEGTCGTSQNLILTTVAHILIWTQPLAHNYWCLRNTRKGRSAMRMALCSSIVTFVVASISLWMGYHHVGGFGLESSSSSESKDGSFLLGIEIQNIHPVMCSHQGPNHLYWMFPYHPLWGHGISWYVWLIQTVMPHLFRHSVKDNDFLGKNWVVGSSVVMGWLVAVVITLQVGGIIHEIPSYWCLISIPWLILPYLIAFVKPRRFLVNEELFMKPLDEKKKC